MSLFTRKSDNWLSPKKLLTKHFGKNKQIKKCKQFYWQRQQDKIKTQSTHRKTNITQKVHSIFKTRKQFCLWGGTAVGPLSSTVNTPQYLSAFFNTISLQRWAEALGARRRVLSQYWTVASPQHSRDKSAEFSPVSCLMIPWPPSQYEKYKNMR